MQEEEEPARQWRRTANVMPAVIAAQLPMKATSADVRHQAAGTTDFRAAECGNPEDDEQNKEREEVEPRRERRGASSSRNVITFTKKKLWFVSAVRTRPPRGSKSGVRWQRAPRDVEDIERRSLYTGRVAAAIHRESTAFVSSSQGREGAAAIRRW